MHRRRSEHVSPSLLAHDGLPSRNELVVAHPAGSHLAEHGHVAEGAARPRWESWRGKTWRDRCWLARGRRSSTERSCRSRVDAELFSCIGRPVAERDVNAFVVEAFPSCCGVYIGVGYGREFVPVRQLHLWSI
jgi:hypothetical protein